MALNPVSVDNYNGLSFLGSSSNKPIAGIVTNIDRHTVSQARLKATDIIPAGYPVKVTNDSSTVTGAGKQLNPNVLNADKATSADETSGFLLVNETDILQMGEKAPRAYTGQLVNVALIGSLTELYLPCDGSVQNVNVNSKVAWDFTKSVLKVEATGNIQIIGPVVDGTRFKLNANGDAVEFENCKVVKVRL